MALLFRPHTWQASAPIEQSTGNVGTPSYGDPLTVRGQITPMSAEKAYTTFGAEASDSFLMLCNLADATSHPMGARVTWGSLTLFVTRHSKEFSDGLPGDHAAFLLSRERT